MKNYDEYLKALDSLINDSNLADAVWDLDMGNLPEGYLFDMFNEDVVYYYYE